MLIEDTINEETNVVNKTEFKIITGWRVASWLFVRLGVEHATAQWENLTVL